MARLLRLLLAACALSACADLQPITAGDCGNGVVEAENQEDCDLFPAADTGLRCGAPQDEHACRFLCDVDDTQSACPENWGCGSDGVCRRGASRFADGEVLPVQSTSHYVGDVDGDGNADILAHAGSDITVSFGNGTGTFADVRPFKTEVPQGPIDARDLDADDQLDVIVPLRTGVFVMLGADDRSLDPVAYSPFGLDGIQDQPGIMGIRAFATHVDDALNWSLGFFVGRTATMTTHMFIAANGTEPPLGAFENFAFPIDTLVTSSQADLDSHNVDAARGELEMAVASTSSDDVHILSAVEILGVAQFEARVIVDFPENVSAVRFGDDDGDGKLDLIVGAGTPAVTSVYVARGNGDATFMAPVRADRYDDLIEIDPMCPAVDDATAGTNRFPLAVAPLGGGPLGDVVSTAGVFIDIGGVLCPTAFSLNPWTDAVVGDLNRDGLLDVAAATEGVEELEVLMGNGAGLFNRTVIPTARVPRSLRLGDFDGDFVLDIAFVGLASLEEDEVFISFGQVLGTPSEPVSMGTFQFVTSFEPMSVVPSSAYIDAITDLMVLSGEELGGGGHLSIALLNGTTERQMLSPFALTTGVDQIHTPLGVRAGFFDPSGDDAPDLITISRPALGKPRPTTLWLVRGSGGASFRPEDAHPVSLLDLDLDLDGVACMIWVTGDIDGDGIEELVGMDNRGSCFRRGLVPASTLYVVRVVGTPDAPTFALVSHAVDGPERGPASLQLADVDGDGATDLVVAYQGRDDGTGAGLVVYWSDGESFDLAGASSALPLPAGAGQAGGGIAFNADADARLELAITTGSGLVIAHVADDRTIIDVARQNTRDLDEARIQTGDVDSDGVTDLVLADGVNIRTFIGVPEGVVIP